MPLKSEHTVENGVGLSNVRTDPEKRPEPVITISMSLADKERNRRTEMNSAQQKAQAAEVILPNNKILLEDKRSAETTANMVLPLFIRPNRC